MVGLSVEERQLGALIMGGAPPLGVGLEVSQKWNETTSSQLIA